MSQWLKCQVSKGMFSDELTVTVSTRSGEKVAVFVPKDAAEENSGRVRVRVAQRNGHSFVLLPDEHQSVVDVQASDVQSA